MRTHIFWKIYFWFLLVVVGLLFGASLVLGLDMIKILDSPVSLIALAGLFGFAYQKTIGGSIFWKVWLPFVVVWDIFVNFLWNGVSGLYDLSTLEIAFVIAIFYLLFLGEYVALYLYGFCSPKIWSKSG